MLSTRSDTSRRRVQMLSTYLLLACIALSNVVSSSPVVDRIKESLTSNTLSRRAGAVNYTDPNKVGGQMLTIISNLPNLGEPINAIVSGLSDESVLSVEGFFLWATSVNMGVSCYGQTAGSNQYANLGNGNQTQGNGDGGNGVLRWNYYDPSFGTCIESLKGGNHLRWFQQQGTKAIFLAVSVELEASTSHMIATNGYNVGRDEFVGNATFTNGTAWGGNLYNTTVEWIPAGVLLNATSDGVNHPTVALPGQPTQDGRVALLTIRQLRNFNAENSSPRAASAVGGIGGIFTISLTIAAILSIGNHLY